MEIFGIMDFVYSTTDSTDMSMIDRIGFFNDFIYGFLTPSERLEHCYPTYHSIDNSITHNNNTINGQTCGAMSIITDYF
jgi:hypothetical protein